jgi:hypothetical protein
VGLATGRGSFKPPHLHRTQELVFGGFLFDSNNYMLQFIGPILMTASAMTNHTSSVILRTI